MGYDLNSAIAVKENADGLLEQVSGIDLSTAIPAKDIPPQLVYDKETKQMGGVFSSKSGATPKESAPDSVLDTVLNPNKYPSINNPESFSDAFRQGFAHPEIKPNWELSAKATVDEYGKQLQDLLTMPARLLGFPHPAMQSKLATETIPFLGEQMFLPRVLTRREDFFQEGVAGDLSIADMLILGWAGKATIDITKASIKSQAYLKDVTKRSILNTARETVRNTVADNLSEYEKAFTGGKGLGQGLSKEQKINIILEGAKDNPNLAADIKKAVELNYKNIKNVIETTGEVIPSGDSLFDKVKQLNSQLGIAGEEKISKRIGDGIIFKGKPGIIIALDKNIAKIDMDGKVIVATLSQLSAPKVEKPAMMEQPLAGGMTNREIPEQITKWLEKGVTITERQAPIRITDPEAQIKDISGKMVDLPKGHEMTPYKLSNGKIWLHDGKDVVVESGQLTNLANKNLVLGEGQPMAGGMVQPPQPKIDIRYPAALVKQISAMEEREAKVMTAQDAIQEINVVRKSFRHRIMKYKKGNLKEELQGIPAYYITKTDGISPDEAINELKENHNVEVSDETSLAEYLTGLDKANQSLRAEIEQEKPGFITKKETTLLQDKIKAVEMGMRTGATQTRAEVKKLQSEFIDAIDDLDISPADKWRIVRPLKEVQTPAQFRKVLLSVTDSLGRLQDKAARMELIGDIKSLFASQPTKNLPIQYKDQIEAIKNKIDPRQRSLATVKKIESLRAFVKRMEEAGEEVNIPEEKLALLDKQSLDELDIDELNLLKGMIEQLYHQGKTFNRLLTDKKNREFEEISKAIVSDILKGKPMSEDSSFIKSIRENNKSLKGKSLDVIKDFIYANLRPELMLNLLGKEITETLFAPLNKADVSELSEGDKSTRKLWDSQKGINIPQAYVKKYNVGPYKGVTKNNALFIYANSLNEGQLRHLYASGLSDEGIKLFSDFLTPEEKRAVESVWNYYDADQWPRVDKVYAKLNGAHLQKENSYFPIMNLERPADSYSKELEDELMRRFHLKQAGIAKGFTKSRVASKLAFSNFDYFGTIIKNHEMVEHYIAYAEVIRDAKKILQDADIRAAIDQRYGKGYLKILDKWLKDVSYGGDKAINNMLDKMSSFLTQNFITSVLGYNVISASKSLVSFTTGVDKVGGQPVIRAIGKFSAHPLKYTKFVYSKSEMMRLRDFTQEREFKSIMAGREAYLGQAKLWQKFKEWSSTPMMLSDKVTVIPLWLAQYDDVMRKGNLLTNPNLEQEAIDAADTLIRRTQPVGRALHLPETFRGGAFQRAYTLFTNQLNQNFNREYEQTSKLLGGDITKKEWAKTQLYLVVLSGLLIGMIARRRTPTAKEMVYDSISQLAGGVFLVGTLADTIAMALLTKQRANVERALLPKSFGALTELGTAATSKTMQGRFKHLMAAMGALTGFPYIQAGRTIQVLEDAVDYLGDETGGL